MRHAALSYVLRYAGLLDEAAQQCEMVRSLDPHNARWHSCVAVFEQTGDYRKARNFTALDNPRSEWAQTHLMQNYARQGRPQAETDAVAYCGKTAESVALLRLSIEANHCGYPAMERDPMLASMRKLPEYEELKQAGIACQEEFLRQKRQFDAALQ